MRTMVVQYVDLVGWKTSYFGGHLGPLVQLHVLSVLSQEISR